VCGVEKFGFFFVKNEMGNFVKCLLFIGIGVEYIGYFGMKLN